MSWHKNLKVWLTISIILSAAGWASGAAEPNDWQFLQLTDNAYDDRYPEVDGSSVVWESWVDDDDSEVLLYDGIATSQLTDNTSEDDYPDVSGSNVVWRSDDHVFLYDGTSVIQLSDNGNNYPARIFGSNIVWESFDGSDYEIYLYNTDTAQMTQVTDNAISDYDPYVSESYVVWYGFDGSDYEVYLYEIETAQITQITNNSYEDRDACVSDSYVVWRGKKSGNFDIFLYDIGTAATTQLTNTMFDDFNCRVSGSNVVWYGLNMTSYYFDIYLYKPQTSELINVTNNSHDDFAPEVSDSGITWYGHDGSDYEIFMYDIQSGQTYQLSDNTYGDYEPKISGRNVVWYGSDGSDMEIFFAGPVGDIEVSFDSYDFGEVDIGTSVTVALTISNVQDGSLTVTDVALQAGGSSDFAVACAALPVVLQLGQSLDVTITFAPSSADTVNATLEILSDDLDEDLIEVEFSGTGMEVASGPEEQMKQILAFFDKAVEDGTLRGKGRGWMAAIRLRMFRFMLLRADYLIGKEMYRASCWQLMYAYRRADGSRWPMDLVVGEATPELAGMLKELIADLDCKCTYGWWPGRMWRPCGYHMCHR
jgi:beta propeller repeat protein